MSPRRYSPSGCQLVSIHYVITMTKPTTKDEITEIKTALKQQKNINISFVGMFFLIAILIVFCVPRYAYETTYETITIEVDPNWYAYSDDFFESSNDNTWIEKTMCDDGVTTEEYNSLNDETRYIFHNSNNETKMCMIKIGTKIRVIK